MELQQYISTATQKGHNVSLPTATWVGLRLGGKVRYLKTHTSGQCNELFGRSMAFGALSYAAARPHRVNLHQCYKVLLEEMCHV